MLSAHVLNAAQTKAPATASSAIMAVSMWTAFALFASSVHGSLGLLIPAATLNYHNVAHRDGWTPKPTAKPVPRYVPDVLRRDLTQTCAYVSAQQSASLYCNAGSYCGYNSLYHEFGCCSEIIVSVSSTGLNGCQYATTCYDSGVGVGQLATGALSWYV